MADGRGAHGPADAARRHARAAAQRVWDVASSGYGPGGAWKLTREGPVRADEAVRLMEGDALRAYRGLAASLAATGADATLGAMVAAATVRRVLDAPGRLPQRLQGVALARRQVLSWLDAHARSVERAEALQAVAGGAAGMLMAGIDAMGGVDLDIIDVRSAPVDAPAWSPGVVLEPAAAPRDGRVAGGVMVVGEMLSKPRQGVTLRTGQATALQALREHEDGRLASLRTRLREMGVAVVVCRKGDADIADALAEHGILVVTNAPEGLARRVCLATGARAQARPEDAVQLGHGTATRRPSLRGGWILAGASGAHAATIEVPVSPGDVHVTQMEAWLRRAGPVLADPRVLPGGWQAEASLHLRRLADHAPGAAPLGIAAVADALQEIGHALVRNHGSDPTRGVLPEGSDAYACLRPAVAAGLDAALLILRIDGVYRKRPSRPEDLRGGGDRIGSPRGMPGDVPPLM